MSSRLEALQPVIRHLPEVKLPKRHVTFKEKLVWTTLICVVFFFLSEVSIFLPAGTALQQLDLFGNLRTILASRQGTIIELGIGPIVTGGIIMQLLVGAGLINLDLSNRKDRALFQGTQKLFIIILSFFEASMLAIALYQASPTTNTTNFLIVMGQLSAGALLILFMDEVVSKWGFGSGVSLFIVAGVSREIIWGATSPIQSEFAVGEVVGAIPNFILKLVTGGNPSEALVRHGVLPDMVGLFATIVVFLVVIYAESMRIEIPLSYGRVRGAKGRYPIRFVYTSVIPVILSVALFQNVRLWSLLLHRVNFPWSHLVGNWQQTERGLDLVGGLAYYLTSPPKVYLPSVLTEEWLHISVYIGAMLISCVIFGILWVDITGMGPKQVARQLQQAGMQIPGFRRDVRIMERVLSRYIPVITILSALFVGALASFGDIWGVLGGGTGILLTTGIIYRLYEEIAREQFTEMFPAVRKFIGAEY